MTPMILALFPLFFLPVTQDFYDTNKWMVLALLALFLILQAGWMFARSSKVSLSMTPATIGLGALTIASLLSLFVSSTNKFEALLNPFGPVTFASLTLISLLSSGAWSPTNTRRFLWLLFVMASILGLVAVYQAAGVAKVMFPKTTFLSDPLWTPTGSSFSTVAIFLVTLPLLIQGILEGRKHKQHAHLSALMFMTLFVASGLGATVWGLIPRITTSILWPPEGWVVLLEILKDPKQALAGVGAENFLTAFTAGRPARLNLTPLWTTRFSTSANFLFHIVTIYGLVGAAACTLFLKNLIIGGRSALTISLILGLVVLLLTPPSLSLLVVIVGLLMASGAHAKDPIRIQLPGWVRSSTFAVLVIAACSCFYFLGRAYLAEVDFAKSLAAASAGDGTATYNLQIKAIKENPKISRFHTTYSQTNLALAVSLSNIISEQSEASEEDKAKNRALVAELIQQAIREAKIAASLNQSNVLAWENLARTYQQLIGVAQGADTWAVSSYTQAIALDPYNPILSLELGGVYIQMKNYSQATTQFIRTTNLKPDFANAWYNLANSYRLLGDNAAYIKALEKTQTLLDPASQEYQIVQEELKGQEASPSGSLTTPAPTPVIVPPLDLPNE